MKKLVDFAHIRAGHSFRTKLVDNPAGSYRVLQMKDLDPHRGVNWKNVVRSEPAGMRQERLTQDDILVVARGGRNHAYYIKSEPPSPTLAAPHFFHVTIREELKSILLPEFLAWQLNQHPTQEYFKRNAEGSTSKSIRRIILEETPICIPPKDAQQAIINLQTAITKERLLAEQLIKNGEKLMAAICHDLTSSYYPNSAKGHTHDQ